MQADRVSVSTPLRASLGLTLLAAAASAPALSCAHRPTIYVRQDVYVPHLRGAYAHYRGRSVSLEVSNQAGNTTTFYYYNPEGSLSYEGAPSLMSYFWYCLDKAFRKAGLKVYAENPPAGTPAMTITLLSVTDREFKFEVAVTGRGKPYAKTIDLKVTAPKGTDSKYLEKRAYGMVDLMAEKILADPGVARGLGK